MLASMLPDGLRYDEQAQAVCLRVEWFMEAIAPVHGRAAEAAPAEANHVDPGLTAGMRRAE